MENEKRHFQIGLYVSVGLHVIIVLMMLFNFQSDHKPSAMPSIEEPIEIVQAISVDEKLVQQKVRELKQQEDKKRQASIKRQQELDAAAKKARQKREQEEARLAELKRQQKLEKQRVAEAKRKAEQERKKEAEKLAKIKREKELLEQKRKDEVKRLAKLEAEKKVEEAKKKAAEAQRKVEEQRLAALEKKRQEEAARRKREEALAKQRAEALKQQQFVERQKRNLAVVNRYTAIIRQKIENNWIQPFGDSTGKRCTLVVRLLPSGEVALARVSKSSGDPAFDDAATRAVYKASPLPLPDDPELIEQFRELVLPFNPQA